MHGGQTHRQRPVSGPRASSSWAVPAFEFTVLLVSASICKSVVLASAGHLLGLFSVDDPHRAIRKQLLQSPAYRTSCWIPNSLPIPPAQATASNKIVGTTLRDKALLPCHWTCMRQDRSGKWVGYIRNLPASLSPFAFLFIMPAAALIAPPF